MSHLIMFPCLSPLGLLSQTGWLKLQDCIFSPFRRLEVQDQGAGGLASPEASLLGWEVAPSLFAAPSCSLSPARTHSLGLFIFL